MQSIIQLSFKFMNIQFSFKTLNKYLHTRGIILPAL